MRLDIKNLNGDAKTLSKFLKSRIISQVDAIDDVAHVAQKYFAGLSNPKRPIANLLFAGPSGTGKTQIVHEIGNFFDVEPLIINCNEMADKHETSKLLGAPPGYLGHGETKPLFTKERIEKKDGPNVILFDEIEKASSNLYSILLSIMDKGHVINNSNDKISFVNSFIFLTCNLGVEGVKKEESKIGFSQKCLNKKEKEVVVVREVKKKFLPEFINRLDKIIMFQNLTREDIDKIFELEIDEIQKRLFQRNGKRVFFSVSEEARDRLVEMGYSHEYGARNLKRVIEKEIVFPLANALTLKEVREGDSIHMGWGEEGSYFDRVGYNKTMGASSYISLPF